MKKQFLRVKQIADQTFLRAEKTEVLTEDLLNAEKRVDTIKVSCQSTQKKIASCNIDLGSETSSEKRLKKIPQVLLASSMLENGNSFTKNSILGETLRECASVQSKLGNELLDYYNEVEKSVLKPVSSVLENEIHSISKLRKQLGKLVLDMDSARTRFQTAERHSLQASSNTSINTMGKVDTLKEELEEASQKVDQCRDALASEMFSLISKEPQLANILVHFHHLQADYHRNALAALETSIPLLENHISNFRQKPVYGCSLEEHLRVTNREIAQVIETCVTFLLEYGMVEEGLLRIAGSASKLKKLKSAFDAGVEVDMLEFIRDPHAVSGALKSYLRELPEPVMTFMLYEEWMDAARIQDFDARLQALWQVLHKLPDANFTNLRYIIKFLAKLHENVDLNKMSTQNIAIVMAPNLIWSPVEDANFGMNMSTTSLHTTIVDMLISYSDWFFPGDEILPTSKLCDDISDVTLNLNENRMSENTEEVLLNDTEVNGNNLLAPVGITDNPTSPHSVHKTPKKPAAPPPPVQKPAYCDKEETNPVGELIDFSNDKIETAITEDINVRPIPGAKMGVEKSISSGNLHQKTNENVSNVDLISLRTERPVVPDKPPYSTYSLDRRSQRPISMTRSTGADNMMEPIPRSRIERPTVPPPERPSKPSRFSSSENLSGSEVKSCASKNTSEGETSAVPLSSTGSPTEKSDSSSISQSNSVPAVDNAKPNSNTPPPSHHSRAASKGNRFDFLVNQNTEKPPERPPRATCPAPEQTETVIYSKTSITENQPQALTQPNLIKVSISDVPEAGPSVAAIPPISPRFSEVEKMKPPRPQPPVPMKPKFNVANENTSL